MAGTRIMYKSPMLNTHQDISLAPKTVVIKTDCYEIAYQEELNRLYFTVFGFWKNAEVVPDLLPDLQKAIKLVTRPFTLLADLSGMVTHPQQLNALHIEMQKALASAGLSHGAYVEPTDKIANFQIEQTIHTSQVNLSRFATIQEAEEWLKSVSKV